jgi:radical SAM superfamily enzyme YgiQ (UPF0313 family)
VLPLAFDAGSETVGNVKVLLISANTEAINMPIIPSGLACVAAATSAAGHAVELVDLLTAGDPRQALQEALQGFHPDAIGISVRNIDNQDMRSPRFLLEQVKDVVAWCRSVSRAPIVLGGAGYSIFPESVLAYLQADMGIRGEGEVVFPILLERLTHNLDPSNVPGLCLPGQCARPARIRSSTLDALPLPDFRPWQAAAAKADLWLPLQTRRGCPLDCSYCSTRAIEGRTLRKRSAETAADAVARYSRDGFQRFYFTDNTFNLPPSYTLEFCRTLASRHLDISWRCILYPTHLDEGLVQEMARAGCSEVSLGFESGCENVLHNMNKKFAPADVRRTCSLLADQGIRRTGFLLLGGPGETMESAEESLAFADSLALEAVKVTVGIRIYPETVLARTALQEGMIAKEDDLLFPRFYLAAGLGKQLFQLVSDWTATRPEWIF